MLIIADGLGMRLEPQHLYGHMWYLTAATPVAFCPPWELVLVVGAISHSDNPFAVIMHTVLSVLHQCALA